jgi:hypothetical protein
MFNLLRGRYPADRWCLVPQVRIDTWSGFAADAVAVALWPSLGPAVHGFEFKASRGDWRQELAQPGKADVVGRYCTHWWLVTPTLRIAREEELPDGWGWLSGEKPKRTPRQQLAVEQDAGKDQLAWDFDQGALLETAPLPPPLPTMADVQLLALWTVRRAAKRAAPPPDWQLCASVLRRAQSALYAQAGQKLRDGLAGRSSRVVADG